MMGWLKNYKLWFKHQNREANPWTRPGFLAAAGVVGLIVVLALVLSVASLLRGDDAGQAQAESPSEAEAPAPDPGPKSACGLPAGDQRVPTAAPAAKWELSGTVALPTSSTYGPTKANSDGTHSCYAHSPTGALFAAAGFEADFANLSSRQLAVRLAPGKTRDDAIANDHFQNSTVRYQVAGFRIIDAKPDNVRIALVVRMTSGAQAGALVVQEFETVWQQGDWLINLDRMTKYAIPDLTGFTSWGGA